MLPLGCKRKGAKSVSKRHLTKNNKNTAFAFAHHLLQILWCCFETLERCIASLRVNLCLYVALIIASLSQNRLTWNLSSYKVLSDWRPIFVSGCKTRKAIRIPFDKDSSFQTFFYTAFHDFIRYWTPLNQKNDIIVYNLFLCIMHSLSHTYANHAGVPLKMIRAHINV